MTNFAWTPERAREVGQKIIEKSRGHLPENLKSIFDKLTVSLVRQRNGKQDHIIADYAIDSIAMLSKQSWYESGRSPNSMNERLVLNLSLSDSISQSRQTENALLIENNLLAYLGQWLSEEQILCLMCDTTRGVRLVTKKHGGTRTENTGGNRTIEIYERSTGKTHVKLSLQNTRGCLFGQWRLSPEAKWVDHGIVIHGIYPETIVTSMRHVGDIINHHSLDQDAIITKAKPSTKTTRFSAAIKTTTRRQILHLATRCPGDGPYAYRQI